MSGVCALIPAAGRGVRFGGLQNKVFAPLLGRPLLGWTLQAFADCDAVDDLVLIGSENDLPRLREIGGEYGGGKVRSVVLGGMDRQASVRKGLAACPDAEYIVVHDGARPCVTPAIIAQVLSSARDYGGAATAAVPVVDTLVRGPQESRRWRKRPDGGMVAATTGENVDRDALFAIQTPQAFRADYLRAAHEIAALRHFQGTDDCSLVKWYTGERHESWYYLRLSSPENLKVTRAEDLALAEAILARRYSPHPSRLGSPPSPVPGEGLAPISSLDSWESEQATRNPLPERGRVASLSETGGGQTPKSGGGLPILRVGHGYDVHPFAEASDNRSLYLGGVAFPDAPRGMKAHSDGDVLLHALCDALLGAAGKGDIGTLFPPSDDRHKDRPSIEFLREVADQLRAENWTVANVDVTVLAETPKIGPRADEMKERISAELGIFPQQVGIKATTNEGLGFIGRGEGVAVHATALLMRG